MKTIVNEKLLLNYIDVIGDVKGTVIKHGYYYHCRIVLQREARKYVFN